MSRLRPVKVDQCVAGALAPTMGVVLFWGLDVRLGKESDVGIDAVNR